MLLSARMGFCKNEFTFVFFLMFVSFMLEFEVNGFEVDRTLEWKATGKLLLAFSNFFYFVFVKNSVLLAKIL